MGEVVKVLVTKAYNKIQSPELNAKGMNACPQLSSDQHIYAVSLHKHVCTVHICIPIQTLLVFYIN